MGIIQQYEEYVCGDLCKRFRGIGLHSCVPLFSNFKPLWYFFVDFEGLGCLFLNGAILLFMVRVALPDLHRLKQLRVETLHM